MKRPLILVSNDDGINSPGIRRLISIMNDFGDVVVVAPDGPQSGKGHAITIEATIRCDKIIMDDGPQTEYSCSGTPVAFIKPADYTRWHAVIKQSVSSTTWTFQVMISGTSTSNPPDVYCFVNADDVPSSSDTHGLLVFKSDGTTKTFDSRKQPLAITGGGTAVAPPSDPTNTSGTPGTSSGHSWNYATNDHDFRSSNRYTENSNSAANTSTAMFSCPSIAQIMQ